MKRHSYKKNNKIVNKRLSKINGGRPPAEDNGGCNIVATLEGHIKIVLYVAFHPSLPLLATGSLDTTAKLWRLSPNNSSPTCLATLEGHSGRVSCVVFHPTAPLLATGSWDKTVRLWSFFPNGTEATCVATLLGHHSFVTAVAFHASLPLIATSSDDNTFKLWRLSQEGQSTVVYCMATYQAHRGWVSSISFHQSLLLLATCSNDNNAAKLWSFLPNGTEATCVATLLGHKGWVTSVAFHPSLPLLATGSQDMSVKLWRFLPNGTEATCVATLLEHRGHVFAVVFHPSAPYLATGSMDTKVKLWLLNADCSAATCVSTLEVSQNGIAQLVMFYPSIAFHSTAPLLAAGSENTVKLWRCKMLEVPYTNFILYSKNTGIDKNICNRSCPLCNINLCIKNVPNPNNINGYVVKLTNGTPSNDFYIHYKCIYRYLLNGHIAINDVSIASETIQQLLHITDKADAITGSNFYNSALPKVPYIDDEGDVFFEAHANS
jgi:WD40 repeat protein